MILTLYAATSFLAAALLFAVQPMFGKMILPVFGGSPAVWVTSLVFFQVALVAGYAYAHLAGTRLEGRRQIALHVLVLLLPLAVLPIRAIAPAGLVSPERPLPSVTAVLLVSIGLPFFVVSTSAPLLQHWFGRTRHRAASDPFFLYAASNAGSLGALLAYPFLIEPLVPLSVQSRIWTVAYALLIVLIAACALVSARAARGTAIASESLPPTPRPSWKTRLHWLVLAAVPSSLMLSVTGYITTDIAAVPLIWVIPLSIYLLTFVLAFGRRSLVPARVFTGALPFLAAILLTIIVSRMSEPLGFVFLHLLVLFVAAMVCHTELARRRPAVDHLTEFYLWLSAGGAVGGLFNVLVAPFIFSTMAEYPLGLVAACLLRPGSQPSGSRLQPGVQVRPAARIWRTLDAPRALAIGLLALFLEVGAQLLRVPVGTPTFVVIVFLVPFVAALVSRRGPLALGAAFASIAIVGMWYPAWDQPVVANVRGFYGAHSIVNRGAYRVLMNGTTNHGAQSLRPDRKCLPLTYYYPTGPLGELFATFTGAHAKSSIGVVGLGTGSTGGYARPGQRWTFYDIDPVVERIARNPAYFTFLRDCVPQARVVMGDARLSIAREPDGAHDVLILDAFTSDAIPVHLLTQEAMALYLRKLAPGGVLAFHISNRFLNLRRPLARLARDAGLVDYVRADGKISPLEAYDGKEGSIWVVMARTRDDLGTLTDDPRWLLLPSTVDGRSWTDDYSDVFGALEIAWWRIGNLYQF